MKYIILLGDGMPDRPIAELGGKTPLQAANTPNMDFMAREGTVGSVQTTPEGYPPGSDVCNLSVLGYDPRDYYTGRAPLEAASLGVPLGEGDVAFRCNLVSLKPAISNMIMEDFSAGHIETAEAVELIEALNRELKSEQFKFYPGMSYRHLMVWKGGATKLDLTPPHDITGDEIKSHLPKGEGAEELIRLMNDCQMILARQKSNIKKKKEGRSQANSVWLWGHGLTPTMPSFKEKTGMDGSLVAAVDLMKGIGISTGLHTVDVPGATGYLDTNYLGKAEYALKELKEKDFVYLHVEAPDEAGHNGDVEEKVRAIENFDKLVVGTVLEGIKELGPYRVMVTSDHGTPIEIRTHSEGPVPFAIYPPLEGREGGTAMGEEILESTNFRAKSGVELFEAFSG